MFRSSILDNSYARGKLPTNWETIMRKRLHQCIVLLATPLATSFLTEVLESDRVFRHRVGLFRTRISPLSDTPVSPENDGDATGPSWDVYVDQSKYSLDRGAAATLDAFLSLAPSASVVVHGAILHKSKAKGPSVRCISQSSASFDVGNVDSVDKVARILQRHMGLQGVSGAIAECLKYKYTGTGHLEAGRVDQALDCYDRAIAIGTPQEGKLLLLRATAYLQRASSHREDLKKTVGELTDMVHGDELKTLYVAAQEPTLAPAMFRRLLQDTSTQETQFRNTQYRHGLYQYSLLQAAQDSLKATQLLPGSPEAWRRAAEILSELWKLRESAQYYQRALELDESNTELSNVMDQLQGRQELLDNARAYGWSEDTLRLALDVAR